MYIVNLLRNWRFGAAIGAATIIAGSTVGGASADPWTRYVYEWGGAPPLCPRDAPDTSLAACTLRFPFGGGYQATASQSLLFRIGDFEATLSDCLSYSTAYGNSTSFSIDGVAVPVTQLKCRYVGPPLDYPTGFNGYWATDFRYVSPPGALSVGTHPFTLTAVARTDYTYSLGCDDPSGRCTVPAGTVTSYASDVTID